MVYGLFDLFLKPKIFFMKRIFFVALAMVVFTGLRAQTMTTTQKTIESPADALSIKEDVHDFGMIPQGKPVYYYFEIANNGPTPLKLENVVASCGCTTPEWNKEPVVAGGTDKIKVGYNAAVEGQFEKFITITYNGSFTKQIRIKGTVWKAPAGSAPSNSSVQFLKQQLQ
jgi:Protein of unknown function (DUF1573)